MNIVEFKDLLYEDFNMHRLFAMNQRWDNGREFSMQRKNRETSAFLYLKDASAEYILENDRKVTFPCGSIIYIPQNSRYKTKFFACGGENAHTQLIEFELLDKTGNPFVCAEQIALVATDDKEYFSELFDEAVDVYSAYTLSYAAMKGVLYSLIVKVARRHQKENIYSKEFVSIAPAINFLTKNPYSDISVAELAEMCHVSECGFRIIFKKYSGKTPSEYCLYNKMKKAKKLLQSNMYSIAEVAEILGYSDAGYFTKVFKKETGVLPSKYV